MSTSSKLRLLGLSLITILGGCLSPQAKPGEEIAVTCHGQEWAKCFRKADRRCGSGRFQLLNQITDQGSSSGNNNSLIHGTFVQRTLVARCTDGKSSNKKQNSAY